MRITGAGAEISLKRDGGGDCQVFCTSDIGQAHMEIQKFKKKSKCILCICMDNKGNFKKDLPVVSMYGKGI